MNSKLKEFFSILFFFEDNSFLDLISLFLSVVVVGNNVGTMGSIDLRKGEFHPSSFSYCTLWIKR